jgi:hypothetical protein
MYRRIWLLRADLLQQPKNVGFQHNSFKKTYRVFSFVFRCCTQNSQMMETTLVSPDYSSAIATIGRQFLTVFEPFDWKLLKLLYFGHHVLTSWSWETLSSDLHRNRVTLVYGLIKQAWTDSWFRIFGFSWSRFFILGTAIS